MDLPAPAYMTISADAADPINGALSFIYTDSKAVDENVGILNQIAYNVKLKEYEGIAVELKDTFENQIVCPVKVIQSDLP